MRRRRVAGIARCLSVTCSVMLFEAGQVSADGVAILVDVHRDSCPSLARAHLARAEDQAKRIFSEAGVRMSWRARAMPVPFEKPKERLETPKERRVHLVLLCGEAARRKITAEGVGPRVLGEAIHDAARAFIYADRVVGVSRRKGYDVAMVLGRVAAHEVGHLLLPPHSHSAGGIMKGSLDLHQMFPESFTPAERLAILQNLQQATPEAEGCSPTGR